MSGITGDSGNDYDVRSITPYRVLVIDTDSQVILEIKSICQILHLPVTAVMELDYAESYILEHQPSIVYVGLEPKREFFPEENLIENHRNLSAYFEKSFAIPTVYMTSWKIRPNGLWKYKNSTSSQWNANRSRGVQLEAAIIKKPIDAYDILATLHQALYCQKEFMPFLAQLKNA